MMLVLFDIAYLIDAGTQLYPQHVGHARYAVINSQLKKMILEEKGGLSHFLQVLWRRRLEFIFDSDYPGEWCFAAAVSNWYLRLNVICEKLKMSVHNIFTPLNRLT